MSVYTGSAETKTLNKLSTELSDHLNYTLKKLLSESIELSHDSRAKETAGLASVLFKFNKLLKVNYSLLLFLQS